MKTEIAVLIIGAGPAGLAAAASLTKLSIPYILLEKDDCVAPLWRKRAYDCIHLHLVPELSQLPYFPHPPNTPKFMSKHHFLDYLDNYAEAFKIRPLLSRNVHSAAYDEGEGKWHVVARNLDTGEEEEYMGRFLVVASGENDMEVVPQIEGLQSFGGEVMHSSRYRNANAFREKNVLVVGSGNSGTEIALDLCRAGVATSIVVRSTLHLVTREIWSWAMILSRYLPISIVDAFVLFMCRLKFGNTSKYGIHRPSQGPFYLKVNTSMYPVVDNGTFDKIKSGEIRVMPAITKIEGNKVKFEDGNEHYFDSIIFATGYKSSVKSWLQGGQSLIGDDGMCSQKYPNHWKGKNGIYCTGLIRKGIPGCAEDALHIAADINGLMNEESKST